MTVWEFIWGGLFIYAIIHFHRKYGTSVFKIFALEVLIGISIAAVIIGAYFYLTT